MSNAPIFLQCTHASHMCDAIKEIINSLGSECVNSLGLVDPQISDTFKSVLNF